MDQTIRIDKDLADQMLGELRKITGSDPQAASQARLRQAVLMSDRIFVELEGSKAAREVLTGMGADEALMNEYQLEQARYEGQMRALSQVITQSKSEEIGVPEKPISR